MMVFTNYDDLIIMSSFIIIDKVQFEYIFDN